MTTIERRKGNATSSNGDLDLVFLIELCEAATAFIVANMPMIKEATLEAIETVFAIKAVAKRLALVMALEAGIVSQCNYGLSWLRQPKEWILTHCNLSTTLFVS